MFNLYKIQKLRVFKIARSFDTNFIEIGCVVSEILMSRDFYIFKHNRQSNSPIAKKSIGSYGVTSPFIGH